MNAVDLTQRGDPEALSIDMYIGATEDTANEFYEQTFRPTVEKILEEQLGAQFKCITFHEEEKNIELPMTNAKMNKKSGANTFSCDCIISCGGTPVACDMLISDFKNNK